jgi:hypothetical protein
VPVGAESLTPSFRHSFFSVALPSIWYLWYRTSERYYRWEGNGKEGFSIYELESKSKSAAIKGPLLVIFDDVT